jgi:hypothetical protein
MLLNTLKKILFGSEDCVKHSELLGFRNLSIVRRRSQWPRNQGHELSPLARMLGLWVRIPLEEWMSIYV